MQTQASDSETLPPRRQPHSLSSVDGVLVFVVVLIIAFWVYTRSSQSPVDPEHLHQNGANGGILIALDRNRYHAEIVVEQGGVLRLLTLGSSPDEVLTVESQQLVAYIESGNNEVVAVALRPQPQLDDEPGRTSQFVGQMPAQLSGRPIHATIAALRIDGRRYRLRFTWPGDDAQHPPMPAKLHDEAERKLYLEPAGRYTEADIRANGGVPASTAFTGFRAQHDFNPQLGDRLCPVTRTKANPDCGWIIDGQRYTFCCPPCIDEFLTLAKEQPDQIQPPAAYTK